MVIPGATGLGVASRFGDDAARAAATRIPGRVQSRINVSNKGLSDVLRKHADGRANKLQFSINETEIRSLLQEKSVVKSPVSRLESGNFVRQVELGEGRIIGNLPQKFGGDSTSQITIITDKYGNLINTFPGPLRF